MVAMMVVVVVVEGEGWWWTGRFTLFTVSTPHYNCQKQQHAVHSCNPSPTKQTHNDTNTDKAKRNANLRWQNKIYKCACWFKKKSLYSWNVSTKQARLMVNAHKHNLLINSFCNNGYVFYIKQQDNNNKNQWKIKRERERMLLCAASNYLIEFVIPWQNGRTG